MDNPSPVPHGVAVEGNGVDKDGQTVNKGGKSTVTVPLKKGTYTFYCPVDGPQAGRAWKASRASVAVGEAGAALTAADCSRPVAVEAAA